MKKSLAFETVAIDTHLFPAGQLIRAGSTYRLFDGVDGEVGEEVTRKHEEAIIKWLLQSAARTLLFKVLGIANDSFVDYSVKGPVIENPQEKPGDIDILICENGRADQTIAIQCKAVKVIAFNQDEDKVNKVEDIGGAVIQANKQREKLGFYRNYACVMIKVQGRKRDEYNVLFRGVTQSTMKRLYEFPQRERLHEDVGIIFIEILQPTSRDIDQMVVVGICHDVPARRLDQSPRLTNRIKDYLKQREVREL